MPLSFGATTRNSKAKNASPRRISASRKARRTADWGMVGMATAVIERGRYHPVPARSPPILAADDQPADGPHHGHHRTGRLLPRRAPAREGLSGLRHDPTV